MRLLLVKPLGLTETRYLGATYNVIATVSGTTLRLSHLNPNSRDAWSLELASRYLIKEGYAKDSTLIDS